MVRPLLCSGPGLIGETTSESPRENGHGDDKMPRPIALFGLGGFVLEAVMHSVCRRGTPARLVAACALFSFATLARAADGPAVFGIPVDFILFALTLFGVALFHHHVLKVALTGLAVIAIYKILLTGFKAGAGIAGFGAHMAHEWVLLTNLLCLLVGFALLARHFEDSGVPEVLPRLPPEGWLGTFRAARHHLRVVGLPRQHCRGTHRRHRRAASVFKRKVHIGYLAQAIVRGIQCRRRRQRGGRHRLHHHDVDRRCQSARRGRGLHRGSSSPWWIVRHPGSAARRTGIRPSCSQPAGGAPCRLGARRHCRRHPFRRHRHQRDRQPEISRGGGLLHPARRRRSVGGAARRRAAAQARVEPAA